MTIRQFLDAILTVIGSTSLTDDEYEAVNVVDLVAGTFNIECYDQLLAVVDARETASDIRVRLRYYFLARGTEVPSSDAGSSEIFLGAALCE